METEPTDRANLMRMDIECASDSEPEDAFDHGNNHQSELTRDDEAIEDNTLEDEMPIEDQMPVEPTQETQEPSQNNYRFTEYDHSEPILPAEEQKRLLKVRLNHPSLEFYNSNIDWDRSQYATSLTDCCKAWIEKHENTAKHAKNVETLVRLEQETVKMMNQWCCKVNSPNTRIAVRFIGDSGYYYVFKFKDDFRAMLEQYKLSTYNKADYQRKKDYVRGRRGLNPSGVKKNKEGEETGPGPIRVESESLANIWLNHKDALDFDKTVCNPRPPGFKYAAAPSELNLWSGLALKRDDVVEYTNWSLLRPLFNHLNYTCKSSVVQWLAYLPVTQKNQDRYLAGES